MSIYSEETVEIKLGAGLYSADLPSAIPEGFCSEAVNLVPTGQSIESRYGFRKSNINYLQTPVTGTAWPDRDEIYFSRLESNQGSTLPAMVWGGRTASISNAMFMVRDSKIIDAPTAPVITDGYAIINLGALGRFRGALNYNGTMYIATTLGVYKVTGITWSATPSISTVSITGPVGCTTGLFHFQDRLWTTVGNRLHYTDPPSSPGGLPEANFSTNFISVVGKTGPAEIMQVIPLGTRLFIFTNLGLFVLSTLGAPGDWYLKNADATVRCNTISTAFELSGVIYYICSLGIFATTGSSVVKLSGAIENVFLAGNQTNPNEIGLREFTEYRLHYLDGGMIASISPQVIRTDHASGTRPFYDSDKCVTLYSRADSIAWSEWEFPPTDWDSSLSPNYDEHINAVIAVADSISTYLNSAPLSYVWMAHSNSKANDSFILSNYAVLELFNYDGFQDSFTRHNWSGGVPSPQTLSTRWVNGLVRTAYFDGGDIINLKQFKYAFMDLYFPNPEAYSNLSQLAVATPYLRYSWNTDQRTYIPPNSILYDQDVPDTFAQEFANFKLWADFKFRTAQLELRLWTKDNTNYKIRSIYLKQFTSRDGAKPYQ